MNDEERRAVIGRSSNLDAVGRGNEAERCSELGSFSGERCVVEMKRLLVAGRSRKVPERTEQLAAALRLGCRWLRVIATIVCGFALPGHHRRTRNNGRRQRHGSGEQSRDQPHSHVPSLECSAHAVYRRRPRVTGKGRRVSTERRQVEACRALAPLPSRS